MDVAADASALGKHERVIASHRAKANLPVRPCRQPQHRRTRDIEPVRLVERRPDREIEHRLRFLPEAVVRRGYAKAVVARRQVRIGRLPPSACVRPVAIEAIELVTEPQLGRRGEADGCVGDLDHGVRRCGGWQPSGIQWASVGQHVLDSDRGSRPFPAPSRRGSITNTPLVVANHNVPPSPRTLDGRLREPSAAGRPSDRSYSA